VDVFEECGAAKLDPLQLLPSEKVDEDREPDSQETQKNSRVQKTQHQTLKKRKTSKILGDRKTVKKNG